jgi:hypothetical protein
MAMLRDLEKTSQFWQVGSIASQLAFMVSDYNVDSVKRRLPQNEILVMALNEIAYSQSHGFFFYLRTCDARHSDDKVLLPESRRPSPLGSVVPPS